jgi:hypothetical protein
MNEVATPPQHKVENIATSNYFVTHHRADPKRVIVSFASRGFNAAGEPIEEFARTLAAFGVSAIFVTDRSGQWWNHPETFRIFPEIARLCSRYEHIGLIGESMGASGAIAFSRFLPEAARILGFSPQYSVASPFIEFDKRYRNAKDEIGFFNFAAYNDADARRKAQLLFGNVEWEDHIHASMFLSEGFKAGFIDGAPHDVAGHLKTAYNRNVLSTLSERFCDFARPFDDDAIASAVGDLYGPP